MHYIPIYFTGEHEQTKMLEVREWEGISFAINRGTEARL